MQLLVPVGLEKRVAESVYSLALRCNAADSSGPRFLPFPGRIFTAIDAIALLTGAQACLLAAGGMYGAEGAVYLGIEGDDSQVQAALELVAGIQDGASRNAGCRRRPSARGRQWRLMNIN